MIIGFPGTRGEIEESSKKHKYHSSLSVSYRNTNILIDYGEKHSDTLKERINSFDAIFITHAHPDHYVWTLKEDNSVSIPVYLTKTTLEYSKYKPANYRIIGEGKKISFKDIRIAPLRVIHSLRCPAVCYRIEGDRNIIYAPDIIDIQSGKETAFNELDCLIADGSSLNINMVRRKKDGKLFGHTMVRTVVNWCKNYNIDQLIITHCGKQIVIMDEGELDEKLEQYSEGRIDIKVAYDGYRLEL